MTDKYAKLRKSPVMITNKKIGNIACGVGSDVSLCKIYSKSYADFYVMQRMERGD